MVYVLREAPCYLSHPPWHDTAARVETARVREIRTQNQIGDDFRDPLSVFIQPSDTNLLRFCSPRASEGGKVKDTAPPPLQTGFLAARPPARSLPMLHVDPLTAKQKQSAKEEEEKEERGK